MGSGRGVCECYGWRVMRRKWFMTKDFPSPSPSVTAPPPSREPLVVEEPYVSVSRSRSLPLSLPRSLLSPTSLTSPSPPGTHSHTPLFDTRRWRPTTEMACPRFCVYVCTLHLQTCLPKASLSSPSTTRGSGWHMALTKNKWHTTSLNTHIYIYVHTYIHTYIYIFLSPKLGRPIWNSVIPDGIVRHWRFSHRWCPHDPLSQLTSQSASLTVALQQEG